VGHLPLHLRRPARPQCRESTPPNLRRKSPPPFASANTLPVRLRQHSKRLSFRTGEGGEESAVLPAGKQQIPPSGRNDNPQEASVSSVVKWDIFHYIYAVLHHADYRERYTANLRRELSRIPFASATTLNNCHSEPAKAGEESAVLPAPNRFLPPVGMTTLKKPLCPLCPLWFKIWKFSASWQKPASASSKSTSTQPPLLGLLSAISTLCGASSAVDAKRHGFLDPYL
jgi:hypothetical protein